MSSAQYQDRSVQAYFERAAEDFDRLYAPHRQSAAMRWVNRHFRSDVAARFLKTLELAERISPKSVLDVGCGSGRYLSALAAAGAKRLVGIDLSDAMIELARRETEGFTGVKVDLIRSDFLAWKTKEAFDLVVAMGLYDYVAHPLGMLKRMRALTQRAVIASFPSRHWLRTPIRRCRYYLKRCPVYFYDCPEIESLGRDAGFAATEITKIGGAGMDYVAVFWRAN
jgi:2-polyprenyl-3-methyl-5-hydroxy-6-metoxy-1,4-benzoquinol methylase